MPFQLAFAPTRFEWSKAMKTISENKNEFRDFFHNAGTDRTAENFETLFNMKYAEILKAKLAKMREEKKLKLVKRPDPKTGILVAVMEGNDGSILPEMFGPLCEFYKISVTYAFCGGQTLEFKPTKTTAKFTATYNGDMLEITISNITPINIEDMSVDEWLETDEVKKIWEMNWDEDTPSQNAVEALSAECEKIPSPPLPCSPAPQQNPETPASCPPSEANLPQNPSTAEKKNILPLTDDVWEQDGSRLKLAGSSAGAAGQKPAAEPRLAPDKPAPEKKLKIKLHKPVKDPIFDPNTEPAIDSSCFLLPDKPQKKTKRKPSPPRKSKPAAPVAHKTMKQQNPPSESDSDNEKQQIEEKKRKHKKTTKSAKKKAPISAEFISDSSSDDEPQQKRKRVVSEPKSPLNYSLSSSDGESDSSPEYDELENFDPSAGDVQVPGSNFGALQEHIEKSVAEAYTHLQSKVKLNGDKILNTFAVVEQFLWKTIGMCKNSPFKINPNNGKIELACDCSCYLHCPDNWNMKKMTGRPMKNPAETYTKPTKAKTPKPKPPPKK